MSVSLAALFFLTRGSDEVAVSTPARIQIDEANEATEVPEGSGSQGDSDVPLEEESVESEGDRDPIESTPPTTELERNTGDLGLTQAISSPTCAVGDPTRWVIIAASLIDPDRYPTDTQAQLENFPGSGYLRTDTGGCTTLRQDYFGVPIYAVYYGPYQSLLEACTVLGEVGRGSYIKPLSAGEEAPSVNLSDC